MNFGFSKQNFLPLRRSLVRCTANLLHALDASTVVDYVTINAICFPLAKRRAEFLALVLLSLMVLHKPEGPGMEDAMAEVATRASAEDGLSVQVCWGNTRYRFCVASVLVRGCQPMSSSVDEGEKSSRLVHATARKR